MSDRVFVIICISTWLLGCGVRGNPLPPLEPTEVGRGRPTYKKAMKEVVDPSAPEEDSTEDLKKTKKKGY